MPNVRTVLFWLHLVAGTVAGLVILLMCVTGVALTYEKQVLEWADRRAHTSLPSSDGARLLPPERLLAAVAVARPGAVPTRVTRLADPAAPVTVAFDGNRAVLVHPETGAILGEPAPGLRAFFRATTGLHRWLALDGASRATGRFVTGAANLAFLFIVLSGLYLWLPRVWTWTQLKLVLWFRRGLPGKARHFNWHNVIGVWSAVPLAIVVAGAVPISFPWASNLVYRMVGEAPPPRPAPAPAGGAAAAPAGDRRGQRGESGDTAPVLVLDGIDQAWARAEAQSPSWRTISLRLGGAPAAPLTFTIDTGYGGQPQKRGTLSVDRATASVTTWETFDQQSAGRRLRSWLRFVHTGEYDGLTGQTVAGLVSAGGAVLVYTGLALSWRRFLAWLRRRAQPREENQRAA